MKKSTLFISAVLTTFVLAVLAGAITAYRAVAAGGSQVNEVQSTAPLPAEASALTPQEAALVAAQHLGRSDLYSVESSSLDGTQAFKVTFSSGDVVYVSPGGQVLGVEYAQLSVPQAGSQSVQANGSEPFFSGGEDEDGDND